MMVSRTANSQYLLTCLLAATLLFWGCPAPAQTSPAAEEEELLSLPPIDEPLDVPSEPEPIAPSPVREVPPQAVTAVEPEPISDEAPVEEAVSPVDDMPEALPTAPETAVVQEAATPTSQEPTVTPTTNAATALTASVDPSRPWGGSLMFPKQRMTDLVTIYDAYLANQAKLAPKTAGKANQTVNVQDIIRGATGQQQEIPEEILTLTLSSIVYYNPNDWSIWLNGKRYFRQDAMDGFVVDKSTLRVVSATKEQVTLVWTPVPESVSRVGTRWQERQTRANQPKPALMSDANRVAYNMDEANVTITLTPNQTFLSQQMAVFEGKVSPSEAAASVLKAAVGNAAAGAVSTTTAQPGEVEVVAPATVEPAIMEESVADPTSVFTGGHNLPDY